MALEEVERIPWVPFVGAHGGKLLGMNAEDYLKSKDSIIVGFNKDKILTALNKH